MALIGGPLFEEPGWTGFAQVRLQRLYGSLAGGLILGSLWALWHLPGFLIPSQDLSDIPPRGTVLDFAVFAFALVGLRLIIIWVVNNTRDSVLMAILVHASWNTFYATSLIRLFPTPGSSWQLLEPHDRRVRIGASADSGDPGTAGLPERGRHAA